MQTQCRNNSANGLDLTLKTHKGRVSSLAVMTKLVQSLVWRTYSIDKLLRGGISVCLSNPSEYYWIELIRLTDVACRDVFSKRSFINYTSHRSLCLRVSVSQSLHVSILTVNIIQLCDTVTRVDGS